MELRKHEYYEEHVWPKWIKKIKQSPHHVIFLHGIMGSEIYDNVNKGTRWLDLGIWHEVDNLAVEQLTPEGLVDSKGQELYARSTVHAPIVKDPYSVFLKELQAGLFCFDWRESIPIEIQRLALFLEKVRAEVQEPVNFITHSMGGCVLLYFLGKTTDFDDYIDHIVCCAPPFHGALKPIRAVEDGDGLPVDKLVRNSVLRESASTMPGLFQLAVAPPEYWVHQVPDGPELVYPVRSDESLYGLKFWTKASDLARRSQILQFAERYHEGRWNAIDDVLGRFGDKLSVVVGLNGKTTCSVTKEQGRCVLHKVPEPEQGKISNGDGTVLFQSSYLPGLPTDHYWGAIPKEQKDTHGKIVDDMEVIHDIKQILQNQKPTKLIPYADFIGNIDWTGDLPGTRSLRKTDNLDYIERARLREVTPKRQWGQRLNPGGNDALTYFLTEQAALQVLNGQEDLEAAARRIGQTPEFLEEYIQRQLMPVLF